MTALAALFLAAHAALAADDVLVRTRVDRSTVHQDETLTYTIEIIRAGDVQHEPQIRIPDFSASGFDPVSSFSSTQMVMAGQGVRLSTQHAYVLKPTRTGELTIASPEVSYVSDGRKRVQVKSDAVPVLVLPPGGLRDVKGPMRVPPARWPWAVAAAGVVAAGALGFLWWRRRDPSGASVRVAVPSRERSPEERALEALTAARSLRDAGKTDQFYVAVSAALRDYVHAKRGVPARETTTRELLRSLERSGSPIAERRALSAILSDCDAVKFARAAPGPADMDTVLVRAGSFVRGADAVESVSPSESRRPAVAPADAPTDPARPADTGRPRRTSDPPTPRAASRARPRKAE